jgi:hypothetical protein
MPFGANTNSLFVHRDFAFAPSMGRTRREN